MEQWLEVTIRTASGGIDLLCAELTEAGFDSFVIDDSEQFRQFLDGARAYWDYVDEKLAARMRDLPHPGRGLGQFLETELPPPASG